MFISHGHHDHLDPPSLRRIPGKPTLIVPRGFGRLRRDGRASGPVEEVEPGDRLTIDRVRFEVVYAEHSGRREPLGPSGPAIGCVIEGSRTVYFPGDTDLFPAMGELAGRLDVAHAAGLGLGPDDRRRATSTRCAPRPSPPSCGRAWPSRSTGAPSTRRGCAASPPAPFDEPGRQFAAALAGFAPDLEARVLAPGESLDLPEPAA